MEPQLTEPQSAPLLTGPELMEHALMGPELN